MSRTTIFIIGLGGLEDGLYDRALEDSGQARTAGHVVSSEPGFAVARPVGL